MSAAKKTVHRDAAEVAWLLRFLSPFAFTTQQWEEVEAFIDRAVRHAAADAVQRERARAAHQAAKKGAGRR